MNHKFVLESVCTECDGTGSLVTEHCSDCDSGTAIQIVDECPPRMAGLDVVAAETLAVEVAEAFNSKAPCIYWHMTSRKAALVPTEIEDFLLAMTGKKNPYRGGPEWRETLVELNAAVERTGRKPPFYKNPLPGLIVLADMNVRVISTWFVSMGWKDYDGIHLAYEPR